MLAILPSDKSRPPCTLIVTPASGRCGCTIRTWLPTWRRMSNPKRCNVLIASRAVKLAYGFLSLFVSKGSMHQGNVLVKNAATIVNKRSKKQGSETNHRPVNISSCYCSRSSFRTNSSSLPYHQTISHPSGICRWWMQIQRCRKHRCLRGR